MVTAINSVFDDLHRWTTRLLSITPRSGTLIGNGFGPVPHPPFTVAELTEQRLQLVPPPLPFERPRPLTPSPPEIIETQKRSAFFRLPPEVRLLIYQYVVGDGYIHVVTMHGRMGSKSCWLSPPSLNSKRAITCKCLKARIEKRFWGASDVPHLITYTEVGIGVMPLVKSCKRACVPPFNSEANARACDPRG